MEYTKQPITLAEQINILKQRGLIFEDEEQAIAVLNHISYFRLASYWRVMEENSRIHRLHLPTSATPSSQVRTQLLCLQTQSRDGISV